MIYFIRHGQTDWNVLGLLQGQTDIPLNDTGIEQARQIANQLQGVVFDKVFCSPLTRAVQTCKIAYPQGEITLDERLLERSFRQYEGKRAVDFKECGFWNGNLPQSGDCESLQSVVERVFGFLDEITAKYSDKKVLVVAHGGVGMVLQSYFLGKPSDGDYYRYLVPNCAVLVFDN